MLVAQFSPALPDGCVAFRGRVEHIASGRVEYFSDERMKEILTKAAEVANATARTMLWYERDQSAFLYEGSYWKRGFVGGSYEFLKDEGMGGRNLDARSQFFYFATVNTPAMTWKLVGKGWFLVLRLYSPTEPWFDKTWRPGEIELID